MSVFGEYTYSKRTFDVIAPTESQYGTSYDIHEPSLGMISSQPHADRIRPSGLFLGNT